MGPRGHDEPIVREVPRVVQQDAVGRKHPYPLNLVASIFRLEGHQQSPGPFQMNRPQIDQTELIRRRDSEADLPESR